MNDKNFVIGDADILVSLYFKEDVHNRDVVFISEKLNEKEYSIIFPNTAITEAMTTLQRKLSNPTACELLTQDYKKNIFKVQYIDEKIMQEAARLFNPHGSKQNTYFDAIVLSTAKVLKADAIFSFDSWYKKQGFKMVEELF